MLADVFYKGLIWFKLETCEVVSSRREAEFCVSRKLTQLDLTDPIQPWDRCSFLFPTAFLFRAPNFDPQSGTPISTSKRRARLFTLLPSCAILGLCALSLHTDKSCTIFTSSIACTLMHTHFFSYPRATRMVLGRGLGIGRHWGKASSYCPSGWIWLNRPLLAKPTSQSCRYRGNSQDDFFTYF